MKTTATKLRVRLFFSARPDYEIASEACMHPSRLSALARGKDIPRYDEAGRIAEALGCEIEEIFDDVRK